MDTPKTSKAKREANDRWDKEHMITLGCKVKREEAATFKEYADSKGKTSNALLKEFVYKCIAEHIKNNETKD